MHSNYAGKHRKPVSREELKNKAIGLAYISAAAIPFSYALMSFLLA